MALINKAYYDTHIASASKNASQWTSENPTLLKGEFGIETDTKRFKIGDGSKNWKNLEYADADIRTSITEINARLDALEELAEAVFNTTNAVIRNIMKGEVKP